MNTVASTIRNLVFLFCFRLFLVILLNSLHTAVLRKSQRCSSKPLSPFVFTYISCYILSVENLSLFLFLSFSYSPSAVLLTSEIVYYYSSFELAKFTNITECKACGFSAICYCYSLKMFYIFISLLILTLSRHTLEYNTLCLVDSMKSEKMLNL